LSIFICNLCKSSLTLFIFPLKCRSNLRASLSSGFLCVLSDSSQNSFSIAAYSFFKVARFLLLSITEILSRFSISFPSTTREEPSTSTLICSNPSDFNCNTTFNLIVSVCVYLLLKCPSSFLSLSINAKAD